MSTAGRPEKPQATGAGWMVVPVRVVALVVVVPLRLIYEGLRGLWRATAWGFRLLGRVLAAIGRGLYAALLRPLGLVLVFLLVRPAMWIYAVVLTPLGRAVWWLLERVVVRPAFLLGRALAWLVNLVVVVPAVLLWRYVLRHVAAVLVWAWRATGSGLAWLWRHVLRPVWVGVAGSWRLAGRGIRWLWRHLVVAPCRWTGRHVLRPIGRVISVIWRVTVRDPGRWVRRNVLSPVRQAGRDVRLTIRRAFRGA